MRKEVSPDDYDTHIDISNDDYNTNSSRHLFICPHSGAVYKEMTCANCTNYNVCRSCTLYETDNEDVI